MLRRYFQHRMPALCPLDGKAANANAAIIRLEQRIKYQDARLQQLEAGGASSSSAGAVAGAAIVTRLSDMLRTVSTIQACKRLASASSDLRQALDSMQSAIWRLHSRARKLTATNNVPATAIRLLPLGDSITDGGAKLRSYRYHLHQLLAERGHQVEWLGSMRGVFDKQLGRNASRGVVLRGKDHADWPEAAQAHEGHWGWTTRQVLRGHERQPQRGAIAKWLKQLQLQQRQRQTHPPKRVSDGGGAAPDVTLIHLGTNDLTKLVLRENGPHERVQAVARRAHTIVSMLCKANWRMHILLAVPIPYCRFRSGDDAQRARQRRSSTEAAYARRLCAPSALHKAASGCQGPTRVACVNMTASVGCEHLVGDGVHPAAAGARRMAAAWLRALEPRLQKVEAEAKGLNDSTTSQGGG